jgi:hypothetical protein
MNRAEQAEQAEAFRKHRGPQLLLLPNAWDAMSARVFVAAGFDAIATTSRGVAWSLGYTDGEQARWNEVVAATARNSLSKLSRCAGRTPRCGRPAKLPYRRSLERVVDDRRRGCDHLARGNHGLALLALCPAESGQNPRPQPAARGMANVSGTLALSRRA